MLVNLAFNLEFMELRSELLNQGAEVSFVRGVSLARLKNVNVRLSIFGDCGGEVNLDSYLTFFILISSYRLCSTRTIFPISLRCGQRGDRPPPSFAYRFTDEALQQKEQVFKKSCGIGNRSSYP